MANIVLSRGRVSLGKIKFPNKKKPVVGVVLDGTAVGFGTFYSEEAANAFMDILATFVGASEDDDADEDEE